MGNPRGVKELNRHLNDERLTPRQMILAKCADCMGRYFDGKADCKIPDCPLYPLTPYGKHPVFRSRPFQKTSVETLNALARGRTRAKKLKSELSQITSAGKQGLPPGGSSRKEE